MFGPFYFFYRKAWKPAFGFLAAELVVALPTPVSYTHLAEMLYRMYNKWASNHGMTVEVLDYPVSYTHLDVYKRQGS